MSKWYYWHPDLVREGIVKQGQPPIRRGAGVPAPRPAEIPSEIPEHMIKPEKKKYACVGIPPRECAVCGTTYTPNRKNQKVCSDLCRIRLKDIKVREANRKKTEAKRIAEKRYCAVCGKEIPATMHARVKTCSAECNHQRKLSYNRDRRAILKAERSTV